jgi:predicted DNA-binding mobile mystery protein A
MGNLQLQRRQLDRIFESLREISDLSVPTKGWIRAIRSALGMPLDAISKKLGMTSEGVLMLEKREAEGSITLNRLREAANALDCSLIYVIVPNKDLDSVLRGEAARTADKMIGRVSTTMSLEGQDVAEDENKELRNELIDKLIANPKLIWNAQL